MPVLVLIGGPQASSTLVTALASRCESVLCADGGGLSVAKTCEITPTHIIGDGDSLAASERDDPALTIDSDQDTTDLEKVFLYCIDHGHHDVWVAGGLTGDIDHVYGHLSLLAKFSQRLTISFYSDQQVLSIVSGSIDVSVQPGDIVSLLPLPKAGGIITTGLQYPLQGESLELGVRDGIRNKSLSTAVTIGYESGLLAVCYPHHMPH